MFEARKVIDHMHQDEKESEFGMSRRGFLTLGFLTVVSTIIPYKAFGSAEEFLLPERALSFYNTHTSESLKTIYWIQGKYNLEELASINKILRDHRTGDVKAIDTNLLDLLFSLKERLETKAPFHVISGYRSSKTNNHLIKMGRGAAKKSLHTTGKAIDIRLPQCDLKSLKRAALALKGGGVGYYPRSDFVHVDTGRVRIWGG